MDVSKSGKSYTGGFVDNHGGVRYVFGIDP